MKGFLLATVSMVALTSVARAADVPAKAPIYVPAPVADWTGPYLGVQGGAVRRDVLAELGLFGFELDGSKTGGTVGGSAGLQLAARQVRLWAGRRLELDWRQDQRPYEPTPDFDFV